MTDDAGAEVGVHDDRAADQPVSHPAALAARGPGRPPRSRRSTARRTGPPPRAPARRASISVPCGCPAGSQPSSTRGRREDPAEVRVDDRAWRRRRSRRRPGRRGDAPRPHSSMRARQSGAGSASCGASPTHAPSPGCGWASTCRKPALAPGPKPAVAGQLHERRRRRAGPCAPMATASGVGAVVDHDHPHAAGHVLGEEPRDGAHAPLGAVPVEDHDGQHARHPDPS